MKKRNITIKVSAILQNKMFLASVPNRTRPSIQLEDILWGIKISRLNN